MKTGDKVQIRPSFELIDLKIMPLSMRTGEITEIETGESGDARGAWVKLDGEPYLEESEWFIPITSLQHE